MKLFNYVNVYFRPDLDECSILSSRSVIQNSTKIRSCHDKARCVNTVGSFGCECRRGYAGDGFSCTGRQIVGRKKEQDFAALHFLARASDCDKRKTSSTKKKQKLYHFGKHLLRSISILNLLLPEANSSVTANQERRYQFFKNLVRPPSL